MPDGPQACQLEWSRAEVKVGDRSLKQRGKPWFVGLPGNHHNQSSRTLEDSMEKLGQHGRRREEIQGLEGGPVDTATIHRQGVWVGKSGHPSREAVVDRRRHQVHFQRARPAENRFERQLGQCPFRVEWLHGLRASATTLRAVGTRSTWKVRSLAWSAERRAISSCRRVSDFVRHAAKVYRTDSLSV